MKKNDILEELVVASQMIYNKSLTPGKSGNISCRIPDEKDLKVAITKTNISKGMVESKDIIIVDIEGKVIEGSAKPSSETLLHLNIYKLREDINAVVHTHSPYAAGFSMSEKEMKRLEGFGPIKNPYIPRVKYSKPGSEELAHNTAMKMMDEDAVILNKHGVVCAGVNLGDAVLLAEFIENTAKTQFIAHILKSE